MTRVRVLGTTVVVLAAAHGVGGAPPASAAQAQSITFSTTPPSGHDWLNGDIGGPIDVGYVADASATSGMPVTYSIAPESARVCRIAGVFQDDRRFGTGAGIEYTGAGTCTIRADQPGDAAFLPAAQVSQSFVVEKVDTILRRLTARKGVPGAPATTFVAKLERLYRVDHFFIGVEPFPGKRVTFTLGGKRVCSGITNANGIAACKTMVPAGQWQPGLRYAARFPGDIDYKASSATSSVAS